MQTNTDLTGLQLDQVVPELTIPTITEFIQDHNKELLIHLPTSMKNAQFPDNVKRLLESVYILKTLKTKAALKARFLQFVDYWEEFANCVIVKKNDDILQINDTCLVLKQKTPEKSIWVLFYEYLDQTTMSRLENALLTKVKGSLPDEIFLVYDKIERQAASQKDIIRSKNAAMKIVYFSEYRDPNRPFQDMDWIQVGDQKVRGFNFDSVADILNFLKSKAEKGKYSISAESAQGETTILWEGLIFPKELLKNR